MNDDDAVLASRIACLERELNRMGGDADQAEQRLRFNPMDPRMPQSARVIRYDHSCKGPQEAAYRRSLN